MVNRGIRTGGMSAEDLSEPEAVMLAAGYDDLWTSNLTMHELRRWLRFVRSEAREHEAVEARRSHMDLSDELHTHD